MNKFAYILEMCSKIYEHSVSVASVWPGHIEGGHKHQVLQVFYINLTSEGVFFYTSLGGGGGVEYVHHIFFVKTKENVLKIFTVYIYTF